ncbi:MAG: hypothetical protein ACRD96_29420, partial [Bryobacteraceae bacterium]
MKDLKMDYRNPQLHQDVAALAAAYTQLGAYLAGVAKEVASPGAVPSDQLFAQLTTHRQQFETTRANVHKLAVDMLVSPLPKPEELGTIALIDALLKSASSAEQNKDFVQNERDRSLAVLDRVLSITHRESASFKPLADCLAKAAELRAAIVAVAWPHRHAESETLLADKHNLNALLALVEQRDVLDDERWMVLEEIVTNGFGRQLTVAASRGKLQSKAGAPAPAPVPAPPAPVAAAPAPAPAPAAA